MYYTDENGAYVVDGEQCFGLSVSAKDKVVERREIESLTVTRAAECELPSGATPATLDEIVAKFAISEKNPLVAKSEDAGGEDSTEQESEAKAQGIDPDDHTKAELVEMAESAGVSVPAKATKAEIATLINEA